MSMIRVRDEAGQPIRAIAVRLSVNDQDSAHAYDERFTDGAGQTAFPHPVFAPSYTLHVNYTDDCCGSGHRQRYASVSVSVASLEQDVTVIVPRAGSGSGGSGAGESQPLHMDGLTIRRADGSVFRYAGITAFRLFKRYNDGEDIEPLLVDYLTCGGLVAPGKGPNTVRFLACASVLFDLPTNAMSLVALSAFYRLLANYGMFGECVVLADADPDNSVYPNARPTARTIGEQRAFLDIVSPVLAAHWNAIGELGNECSHKITRVDRGAFTRPAGAILWERGSGQADEPPFVPAWDLVGDHSGRQDDWPRRLPARDIRSADGGAWGIHCAAIENEPMGAADTDQPGRRSANPDDFCQFAAHAGMNCNGALFHPDNGLQTTLLSAKQAECGAAFFTGLHFSPPDAQLWPYRRGGLTGPQAALIQHSDRYNNAGVEVDRAGSLRTFSKESPDGHGWSVAMRPGADWRAFGTEGRIVTEQPRRGLVRTQR